MTNYVSLIAAALLFGGAAQAADAPAAAAVPAAGSPARYVQAPGSTLSVGFMQAGAASKGVFKKFATELKYDEKNLATSSLQVKVQIASLDTQDSDRDTTLAGAELLDSTKFPTAEFIAKSFARRADGKLEAVGKLTLRGVTKDLRVPLALKATATGYELTGETAIKRLDYGVGQGEWKSTEWVGDEVKLQYKVQLTRAK